MERECSADQDGPPVSIDVERSAAIEAVTREIQTFIATHFVALKDAAVPVVSVAVGPNRNLQGIVHRMGVLRTHLRVPERDARGDFRLAVDHCFAVPGQGTVLTGTLLFGALSRGSELKLLAIGVKTCEKTTGVLTRRREPQTGRSSWAARDGIGPALVKRAVAVSPPRILTAVMQVVIAVALVPLFQGIVCNNGAKRHSTVGHATVIATAIFFARLGGTEDDAGHMLKEKFDPLVMYEHVPDLGFKYSNRDGKDSNDAAVIFALLQSEHAVFCPPVALVVCSRLNLDARRFSCRLSFYGAVDMVAGSSSKELSTLSPIHR